MPRGTQTCVKRCFLAGARDPRWREFTAVRMAGVDAPEEYKTHLWGLQMLLRLTASARMHRKQTGRGKSLLSSAWWSALSTVNHNSDPVGVWEMWPSEFQPGVAEAEERRLDLKLRDNRLITAIMLWHSYMGFTFSLSCFLILTHKLFNYLRYFIAYTHNLGSLLSFQNCMEWFGVAIRFALFLWPQKRTETKVRMPMLLSGVANWASVL